MEKSLLVLQSAAMCVLNKVVPVRPYTVVVQIQLPNVPVVRV